MGTLQLLSMPGVAEKHEGEIYSCTYSADGSLILTGGWDGQLRLWHGASGAALLGFQASPKPLSCCAISPDGQYFLSGSMEGILAFWDASSQQLQQTFVAHTRPISAIAYSPDGEQLVTASWDRKLVLRKAGKEGDGQALAGHRDIVAGCEYSSDGRQILSWSHDGSLRLWSLEALGSVVTLEGHEDRVTAASLSPDGGWAISGGRDGMVKLWDLQNHMEISSVVLSDEVRGALFLLDGASVVIATAGGGLLLLATPSLQPLFEISLACRIMCSQLAPSGQQIALGGEDGQLHLVLIEGNEGVPLMVTATLTQKRTSSVLERLFGKSKLIPAYVFTCPSCRHQAELRVLPGGGYTCPICRQPLRFHSRVRQMQTS